MENLESKRSEMAPEEKEKINKKYVLTAIESTDVDGKRRMYLPVLAEKAHDFYEANQCQIFSGEDSLENILKLAEKMAEEDEEKKCYLDVGIETPEDHAKRLPVDSEFVLPE